jgi:hypothetical protein
MISNMTSNFGCIYVLIFTINDAVLNHFSTNIILGASLRFYPSSEIGILQTLSSNSRDYSYDSHDVNITFNPVASMPCLCPWLPKSPTHIPDIGVDCPTFHCGSLKTCPCYFTCSNLLCVIQFQKISVCYHEKSHGICEEFSCCLRSALLFDWCFRTTF